MSRPVRCWLGHRWQYDILTGWTCARCADRPRRCRNCGGRHNPTATVVICTVTTGDPS